MILSLRQLVRSMFHLGSGELMARLCSIAIVILLGHRYGVFVVGVYSLGMTVAYYLQPVVDFGLRHIGARLIARYPESADEIMHRVQRRRLLMAGAVLPLTLLYARLARLPPDMKIWLALFSAAGALYALSLEWAAWGREHLRLLGLSRTLVPLCTLIAVGVRHPDGNQVLWWALAGNTAGFLLQAAIFSTWWKRHRPSAAGAVEKLRAIGESLAWRSTSIMGVALISNMAFHSIDMLMLGAMANPEQVGLYAAACRLLNQVLVTYYLMTNVLYPKLARQKVEDRVRMLRPGILLPLFGTGVAIAVALVALRRGLLTLFFGHQFLMGSSLLALLAWVVPLDFLASYVGNAYIAWGMEKKMLLCTTVAAASNIVLNLIWIPHYGATAAAVNTLISYSILLVSLAFAGRAVKEFPTAIEPGPELI